MAKITTMTRKGQVTIPKEVREQLGLQPFDEIEIRVEDDEVRLRKASRSLNDLLGIFPAAGLPLEEAIAKAKAERAETKARRFEEETSEQA